MYYKEESVRKANIREKKLQKSSNCDALVLSSITVVLMLDMMMKLRPWGCCRCASSRSTIESSHQVVLRRVVYVASSSTFTSSSAATNNNWMRDSRTKTIETTMMMRKSRTRNGGRVKMFSTSGSSLSSLSASSADEKNDKYYKQMILLQKQPQQSRRNTKLDVRAFASGSKGGDGDKKKNKATKKKKVTKEQREEEGEEDGDIAWEEEGDEEEEVEAEDINVVYADYDEKDVQGGNIDTASTPWGELALECVKVVLSEEKNIEEFEGNLQLFAFKAIPSTKRIMISVDDLDDQYGSPNLDDLIAVSRKLNELAESKGFPDDVAIEVASPGAERKLTIPEDLLRFRELKMKVI